MNDTRTTPKRSVKASVFTNLFGEKEYLVLLYKALHPGEDVTEDDITNITIQNTLVDTLYNDLGFMVKDKLIVLIEAQSTWSVNIVIRILMYLLQTYQNYIKDNEINLYSSKKISLPEPELYVIFTGDKKDVPKKLSIRKDLFDGKRVPFDAEVKVICNGRKGDIIYQYVMFTKVYNDQLRQYGATHKTIEETIRICKDQNLLKKYLESHESEVVDTMMLLFDDEFVQKAALKEKYREGRLKGKAEGKTEAAATAEKELRESGIQEEIIRRITRSILKPTA